ncbi:MAG: gamma carbonic anhydrase family protein [Gammaproteobacteria bacterium]|nr:gamma carbonic anhydrase family protein [Gammaproteobacteria bacterium]
MRTTIRPYREHWPQLGERVYVDAAAVVIGDVVLGADSSVWPCAVIRGDVASIRIGARSSVQDGAVLHVTHDGPFTPGGRGLVIGDDVTIGHGAVLHACIVGTACLIGMNATILDGVVIEDEVMVAAGALVPPGKRLPTGTLWAGNPARLVRALAAEQCAYLHYSAKHYVKIKDEYLTAAAPTQEQGRG